MLHELHPQIGVFKILHFYYIYLLCVNTCTTAHVLYGGQNNSQESVLPFYHVGPKDQNLGHQA